MHEFCDSKKMEHVFYLFNENDVNYCETKLTN